MPRSLIVRIIVPAAAALSLVAESAWARGPECWNSDEMPAAELYAFHTALMVGALRCRSERPDALSSYNALVQARKSSIDAARTVLQARFIRDLGPEKGLTEFKNFDTEIANRASIAGPGRLPCEGVDTYSRLAASASQADFYTLARLNNPSVEIRSCGLEPTVAFADPAVITTSRRMPGQAGPSTVAAKMDASTETPAVVAASVPATADEQPGDATPTETQPISPTKDTGSETPQEAVVGKTAPQDVAPNVDPAKALEDAARALAAAASSLRVASSADH